MAGRGLGLAMHFGMDCRESRDELRLPWGRASDGHFDVGVAGGEGVVVGEDEGFGAVVAEGGFGAAADGGGGVEGGGADGVTV